MTELTKQRQILTSTSISVKVKRTVKTTTRTSLRIQYKNNLQLQEKDNIERKSSIPKEQQLYDTSRVKIEHQSEQILGPILRRKTDNKSISKSMSRSRSRSNVQKGKYKILSEKEKREIVNLSYTDSINTIAKIFKVSVNNICRWRKSCVRKGGAGRKIGDMEMEILLINWIKVQKPHSLKKKVIQYKAVEYSNSPDFKASKGWYERFLKRNPQILDFLDRQTVKYNFYSGNEKSESQSSIVLKMEQFQEKSVIVDEGSICHFIKIQEFDQVHVKFKKQEDQCQQPIAVERTIISQHERASVSSQSHVMYSQQSNLLSQKITWKRSSKLKQSNSQPTHFPYCLKYPRKTYYKQTTKEKLINYREEYIENANDNMPSQIMTISRLESSESERNDRRSTWEVYDDPDLYDVLSLNPFTYSDISKCRQD